MNESELQAKVVEAFRTCYDPEIPVNIYDLGLIYDLKIEPSGQAYIKMTLTAPSCPVAGILPGQVEAKVRTVPGITDVKLDLVWEPPWNRDMMSDAAKLQLGFDLGFDVVPSSRLRP
ncbi:MAG: SUF system Fe-S cluster assembly protein [Acidobacteria bacterium]|jgi:FeS assembly SUF system protein|nr:MAG: SUF system Fe-S cluster assembly protein [Acidobacteriota bacterium]